MYKRSWRSALVLCLLSVLPFSAPQVARAQEQQVSAAQLDGYWRRSLEMVGKGDFAKAHEALQKIPPRNDLIEQVQSWLDSFQQQQDARKKLNAADFDRYVGYAKQRAERKEYAKALDQAIKALDVAADRDALLKADWMVTLVNDALAKADEYRKQAKWKEAWHIYADLAAIYDHEPRYQKLEREVLTHLRLEAFFDDKAMWKDEVVNVQWRDAENALELISVAYVQDPDFKKITEAGLEHLLLLAESPAAQKTFSGLANENDRKDFEARVKENLEQVRAAPSVDRRECVRRFRRVVKQINPETVRLPEEVLVNELMYGAVQPPGLDDFTGIIWPSDTEEFDKHTRGDFIGVGISIIKNKLGEIEVVTPLEDTPAFRAGIQAGDIILKVDDLELKDFPLNKVVSTITGPRDTSVTLTIRRGETKELHFPLVREKVKIQSVKGWARSDDGAWDYWLDKDRGIAYIRVTNFARNTVEDVTNAMSELRPEGLRGLVLDLRWNPGGLLDSAWQMSSLFLKRGDVVVSTKGRNRGDDQELKVSSDGPYSDVPLVVLVNENSASASEIVSGAIRDNERGTVIGDRTFGKFSVQNLIPLSSSQAKLKITTARYYLPNGDSLHRDPNSTTWGVSPQIAMKLGRWENWNAFQLRRKADLLGPAKPEEEELDLGVDDEDEAEKKDGDKDANAQADAEPKLPPLDQPDKNNRPEADPQVDTALLLLRIKLLAERYPTLATALGQAPPEREKQSAHP